MKTTWAPYGSAARSTVSSELVLTRACQRAQPSAWLNGERGVQEGVLPEEAATPPSPDNQNGELRSFAFPGQWPGVLGRGQLPIIGKEQILISDMTMERGAPEPPTPRDTCGPSPSRNTFSAEKWAVPFLRGFCFQPTNTFRENACCKIRQNTLLPWTENVAT